MFLLFLSLYYMHIIEGRGARAGLDLALMHAFIHFTVVLFYELHILKNWVAYPK
jgi:hypothetical protein